MKKWFVFLLLPFFNCASICVCKGISENSKKELEFCSVNYSEGFYVGEKKIRGENYDLIQVDNILSDRDDSSAFFMCVPKKLKPAVKYTGVILPNHYINLDILLEEKDSINSIYFFEGKREKEASSKKIELSDNSCHIENNYFYLRDKIYKRNCEIVFSESDSVGGFIYIGIVKGMNVRYVKRSRLALMLWSIGLPVACAFDIATFPVQLILYVWCKYEYNKTFNP